jgi:hypothetical protein
MGQATRTTKLELDLGKRTQGGANTSKQAYLETTVGVLSTAGPSLRMRSAKSSPTSRICLLGSKVERGRASLESLGRAIIPHSMRELSRWKCRKRMHSSVLCA